MDSLESSSDSYTIGVGEGFAVLNPDGYMLVSRIISIEDDSRGGPRDLVRFAYNISGPDEPGEILSLTLLPNRSNLRRSSCAARLLFHAAIGR